MDDSVDAFVGILVGGYLLLVFSRGRHGDLATQLLTEKKYLEFVLALIVLYYLTKYDRTGIVAPLVTLMGIASLLHLAGIVDLSGITEKFGNGEQGLFATVNSLMPQGLKKIFNRN